MSHKLALMALLDLYKLQVFVQVARAGSFSAAAERLFMTQPAVSQHMQELEAGLGRTLFQRGRRGVTLTAEGATLRDYAERILALVAEAEIAVIDLDHLASGQVSIGATPGVSGYLLPHWIHDFRERHPALTVALQTATTPAIVAQLLSRQIDLGLIEGEIDPAAAARLEARPICDVAQRVVVGPKHPLWGRETISLPELEGLACATRQASSQSRIWLDGLLRENGVRPRIVAEFDNPEAIKRVVMAGTAFAVLPDYAVRAELERDALKSPNTDIAMSRGLRAAWSGSAPLSPIARAFLAFVMPR